MTTPPLTPAGLRCAHRVNPLGVAPERVRLSWLPEGAGSGRAQTGYQVVVERGEPGQPRAGGTATGGGAVAWDSGRVDSSATLDVEYRGGRLSRGSRYTWKVRIWDETGTQSDWSEPASFEVELDPAGGWRAEWIGLGRVREIARPPDETGPPDPIARALYPVPYLRRAFTVAGQAVSARLRVTALGLYEARLNGARVGDAMLAPGWTDYHRRVLYQTYDVTGLLREGENVLGALLGDGWYCGFFGFDAKRAGGHYGAAPELLAQLVIHLADGSEQWVVTDAARLARRRAGLRADRLLQQGRRGVLLQVARRRGGRAVRLGGVPRRRAAAEPRPAGRTGLGRRRGDRPVDGARDVR